jgi:large subunit ribosomal protein L36e
VLGNTTFTSTPISRPLCSVPSQLNLNTYRTHAFCTTYKKNSSECCIYLLTRITFLFAQKLGKRRAVAREVAREVAGFAPYERRIMELLRNNLDKRALRLAKRRVSFSLYFLFRSPVQMQRFDLDG